MGDYWHVTITPICSHLLFLTSLELAGQMIWGHDGALSRVCDWLLVHYLALLILAGLSVQRRPTYSLNLQKIVGACF